MTFTTRAEAENYITTSLGEYAADHDVEAIADRLYDIAGGTWDIQHINHDIFWAVVADHATEEN